MISYSKALRLIEKISINLKNEKISTINSINRVSAENVLSPNNNPLSNNAHLMVLPFYLEKLKI